MNPVFAAQGLVVVEGLIDERLARILYRCLQLRHWRGEFKRDDQVPTEGGGERPVGRGERA